MKGAIGALAFVLLGALVVGLAVFLRADADAPAPPPGADPDDRRTFDAGGPSGAELSVDAPGFEPAAVERVAVETVSAAEPVGTLASTPLTGRLVDSSGAPVARERLLFALEVDGPPGRLARNRETDEDGNFELGVPDSWRGRGPTRTLRIEDHYRPDGPTCDEVEVGDLPPFETEPIDLGDIVVSYASVDPLIAEGVVLDSNGGPVGRARVVAEAFQRGRPFASARTDPSGRFELHAHTELDGFRLAIRHQGYEHLEVENVRRGSTDLVLSIDALASLSGRLLLPSGLDVSDLTLDLRQRRQFLASFDPASLSESGEIRYDGLPPGSYGFSLSLNGYGAPAFRQTFEILRGEELRPAWLDPLELSSTLFVSTLRVRCERDGEFDWPGVYVDADGAQDLLDRSPWDGFAPLGTPPSPEPPFELRVVGEGPQFDCTVWAPGHRPRRVTVDGPEEDVSLDFGIPVHVDLRALPSRDRDAWIVQLSGEVEICGVPVYTTLDSKTPRDGEDEVVLGAPGAGDYHLSICLRSGAGMFRGIRRDGRTQTVSIDPSVGEVFVAAPHSSERWEEWEPWEQRERQER